MAYKNLNQLRKTQLFCDVDIKVEEEIFSAHRVTLSAASKQFRVMLAVAENSVGNEQKTIKINEVNSKTMEILLNYIYKNILDINSENVEEVFRASDFLDMHLAKEECSQFLIEKLNTKNCIDMFKLGSDLNDINLERGAKVIIFKVIELISKTERFLQLSKNEIQRIFSFCAYLNCSQEHLFDAIMCWVNFNLEERKTYLSILLKYIKPKKCSKTFLKNTILTNSLLKKDILCINWLMEKTKDFIPIESSNTTRPSDNF